MNVYKRYLIAAMAHNLGTLMRALFGMGTPRGLQKAGELLAAAFCAVYLLQIVIRRLRDALETRAEVSSAHSAPIRLSATATAG